MGNGGAIHLKEWPRPQQAWMVSGKCLSLPQGLSFPISTTATLPLRACPCGLSPSAHPFHRGWQVLDMVMSAPRPVVSLLKLA